MPPLLLRLPPPGAGRGPSKLLSSSSPMKPSRRPLRLKVAPRLPARSTVSQAGGRPLPATPTVCLVPGTAGPVQVLLQGWQGSARGAREVSCRSQGTWWGGPPAIKIHDLHRTFPAVAILAPAAGRPAPDRTAAAGRAAGGGGYNTDPPGGRVLARGNRDPDISSAFRWSHESRCPGKPA